MLSTAQDAAWIKKKQKSPDKKKPKGGLINRYCGN